MTQTELQNLISSYNTYYSQGQVSKEELVALLKEEAALRKQINEDSGDYVKMIKRIKDLQKDVNTITKQKEEVERRIADHFSKKNQL